MRAILFDLDRTLVDVQSFTDYAAALADVEAVVAEWSDPPTPETGWDGPTRRAMGILVALSGDPRWQEVSDTIERHEMAAVVRSRPMPYARATFAALSDRPRAVVTLLPDGAARAALERHGIEVDVLVPRRADLRPKPAADQLLEACRILGNDPTETVMVGDSTWDHAAAVAAGIDFIGVTNRDPSEFDPTVTVVETLAGLVHHVT